MSRKIARARPKKKNEKKGNAIGRVFIVLFLTMVVVLSAFVCRKFYIAKYKNIEYDSIRKQVLKPTNEAIKETNKFKHKRKISFDIKEMQKINNEAVGYIYLENSNISHPVVKHSDNEFYLDHDITKKENINGAIYIEESKSEGLDEKNCIIYGHNMNDGSMFADLAKFEDKEYAKSHQTFIVYNMDKYLEYAVISTFVSEPDDLSTYKLGFSNDKEFADWGKSVIKRSEHKFKEKTINENDYTITLSTCTNKGDTRRIVILKKIYEES